MLRIANLIWQRDGAHRRLSPPGGRARLLPGPRRAADHGHIAAQPGAGPPANRSPQGHAGSGTGLDSAGRRLRLWER